MPKKHMSIQTLDAIIPKKSDVSAQQEPWIIILQTKMLSHIFTGKPVPPSMI
jgi:hypothetical protein